MNIAGRYAVELTAGAEQDLDEIMAFVATNDSPGRASTLLDRLLATTDTGSRRGRSRGERGGTPGARAASTAGGAAQRSRPQRHEKRRLCGRRATKRSDWRGGRAGASTSMHQSIQRPGIGRGG